VQPKDYSQEGVTRLLSFKGKKERKEKKGSADRGSDKVSSCPNSGRRRKEEQPDLGSLSLQGNREKRGSSL